MARAALIAASTVEVYCPHCEMPQGNPDNGAHSWMPSEVQAADEEHPPRICQNDACGKRFTIRAPRWLK
jgi:hypothetical protein